MKYYVLNGAGDPVPCEDMMTWARWMEVSPRHVADTRIDETRISTVFLGLDHNFMGGGPPVLYETMVFLPSGEAGDMGRYSTRAQAQAGHALYVRAVESEYQLAHYLTLDALGGIVAGLRAEEQPPTPAIEAPKAKIHHTPSTGSVAARRRRYRINYARRAKKESQ